MPIDAVIQKNRLEVEETGERHFLRDPGLLEGALARPQNAFAYGEDDIVVLAVRYLAGIAQAHAFEQGNKRTAFGAMWHFLRLNGYELDFEDSDYWEGPTVELIEHRLSEEDFADRLRPFVVDRSR
ncbi:MAG: type II toxin-antitoxin system death-on-curing family toxin [Alphaproteobacteria bacterium]|nr:type II toxin-antitoxin system death-on-curing family toxin [Alphaproteobacteria bacterium]